MGCDHIHGEHDAMRDDDATWQTLPLRGYQDAWPRTDEVLELRDAPCRSTLARRRRCTAEQRAQLLGRAA
jgi:hypothetical protein